MTQLPAPPPQPELPARFEPFGQLEFDSEEPELKRTLSWARIARHRWLILGTLTLVVGATAAVLRIVTPVYEAASTLRIEAKAPNLPELFRRTDVGSELETEMAVLRSRTLLEEVARDLALRVVVTAPGDLPRGELLLDVQLSPAAAPGEFILRPDGDTALTVFEIRAEEEHRVAQFRTGEPVNAGGMQFVPTPEAMTQKEIRVQVQPLHATVAEMGAALEVSQPSRDAEIVKVAYRNKDPELAWRVPDALVERFMRQRQEVQKLEAKSTVEFLREQITALGAQLAKSEQNLRDFRQRYGVIQPQAEATSQVGRLVTMQTERGMLEAQRGALAALVAEVEGNAAAQRPDQPSPYRRLLAFPALLQSNAASGLLDELTRLESEREALLVRRTPEDADVQILNKRIGQVEGQLRGTATTYLQSLGNQVNALDAGVADFSRQLRALPQRELQYARLEREPKVLDGIHTMLQTRLKEAEIATAVRDPSVRLIDAAQPPNRPVWPRPVLHLFAGTLCGLLLGIAGAVLREQFDKSVRSRADVRASTGLQVVGLIPHIRHRNGSLPLIAERRPRSAPSGAAVHRPRRPSQGRTFTFFGGAGDAAPQPDPRPIRIDPDAPVMKLRAEHGVVAAALGALETNVAFARNDLQVKLVVFTSALAGEGKTTTTVNFALSLAQRGVRVLLIDADLRRGSVHNAFGASVSPGLAEVMRGEVLFDTAVRAANVGDQGCLHYLTAGKASLSDLGLAASDTVKEFLGSMRDRYDAILVDTPPVSVITDAALLGASADGVVLVARAGMTDATALRYAVDQLAHVGAPVLGVVLNDIDLRRDAAYDSVYKYFATYEYATDSTT